jgi:hypothetical protein
MHHPETFLILHYRRVEKRSVLLFLFTLSLMQTSSTAQVRPTVSAEQMVNQMVQAENFAGAKRQHFLYRRKERSARTRGHLWEELVIETTEGRMHRLVAVDGKPLSSRERSAEDNRITNLANHPGDFRQETQGRREDEVRLSDLLKEIPKMFLFTTVGTVGDCTRITFAPNPKFQETSFQDRVVHAMSGVLLIHQGDMRLCGIDAHLDHSVEFGFGLLGKVSDQSRFSFMRQEVFPGQWKTTNIRVHVDGNILLLKSVSRDEDSSHYDFHPVPSDLKVAQAAAMLGKDGATRIASASRSFN